MWTEVWRRRPVRILLFLVAVLLLLQYTVNIFGFHGTLPKLIWTKFQYPIKVLFAGVVDDDNDGDNNNTGDDDVGSGFRDFDEGTRTAADDRVRDFLPRCPPLPPALVGSMRVSKRSVTIESVNEAHAKDFRPGGFYAPPDCEAAQKVALVIPFRDRDAHLHIFLHHLIPMLMRQQLEFTIYVVDQAPGSKFNRGMLMNIGFTEALKDKDYSCFIFHDVDLLPENDRNIYSCSAKSPRHMSAAVDKFDYKLPYAAIFGGVSAISKEHFLRVNGFSNVYFGWGAEDDDMYRRIKRQGLKLTRYSLSIARYTMLSHGHEGNKAAPDRFAYLNGKGGEARVPFDGVNSLIYETRQKQRNPLFTKITVQIDQKKVRGNLEKNLRKLRSRWV